VADLINLLIVDDHPMVREGFCAVASSQANLRVVAQAGNGQDAVDLYRQHGPDVVLMDMAMQPMDGLAATQAILKVSAYARIIIYSVYETDEMIFQAIKAGAKAFVFKDTPVKQLLQTIARVAAGEVCLSERVADMFAKRLRQPELTRREREVLEYLVAGLNNDAIGQALFISDGTVKTHVNHILAKLRVTDRTQAAVVALQRGLVRLN
jgi:two-component system NarL family response regulator